MTNLLAPYQMSPLTLPNRIVMAPMTRCRASSAGLANTLMADYYEQRASAGLIISEATNVSPMSAAFELAPGIYTDEQMESWKPLVDRVHAAGGRIFMQLWHAGRTSSFALLDGQSPLSPSGLNDDLEKVEVWGQLRNGHYTKIAATASREMTLDEIKEAINSFASGAKRALQAGFDGVEIHAANGYLPHQFLSSTINTREDAYGGTVENRARFLREILEQVGRVAPMEKVGVRVSPFAFYNNMRDANPVATYSFVARLLQDFGVRYVHAADTNGWIGKPDLPSIIEILRSAYSGTLIVNGGLTIEQGEALVSNGTADLIAYGRAFISNPDLVRRVALQQELTTPRSVGWYGGSAEGLTDYVMSHDVKDLLETP